MKFVNEFLQKLFQCKVQYQVQLFTLTMILTLLLLSVFVWDSSITYREFNQVILQEFRLRKLSDRIIYLDEVLTMSAKMNTVTGDQQWQKRYFDYEHQLESALYELINLAPEEYNNADAHQTHLANEKLVNMEHQSFRLVQEGKQKEAFQLLSSSGYNREKKSYATGIHARNIAIEKRLNDRLSYYQNRLLFSGLITGLTLLGLIPTWLLVLKGIKQYLSDSLLAQNQLKITNEELELRVSQRTEALILEKERYRDIFENAIEGIFQSTPDGRFVNVNPALAKIYGYDSSEDLIRSITNIEQQLYVDPQQRIKLNEILNHHSSVSQYESQLYHKKGHIIWISEYIWVKRDQQGNVIYYEGMVEDITQRKHTEETLKYYANHDNLTGLYNRSSFLSVLRSSIASQTHNTKVNFAILFMDLDDFKIVNDSLGHLAGDQLLIQVVHRVEILLKKEDIFSRFGGDEFIILYQNITHSDDVIHLIKRIIACLEKPFYLSGHEVFISTSIGITFSEVDTNLAEDYLRDADIALYQAKNKGKGQWAVFDPEMRSFAVKRLALETDLRNAIERKEFELYYQPIVASHSHNITGFEALVRWNSPLNGIISPAQFIPVAEETGLIIPLGWWILETACHQMKQWQDEFFISQDMTISVNLSSKQVLQYELIDQLEQLLSKIQLNPQCLKLEITEGTLMHYEDVTYKKLTHLRELGVQLSIDDFGTGYSSLSYLHRFPFNSLKIDQSFVKSASTNTHQAAIVSAIVALAKCLNLEIVAEGVETEDQLLWLSSLGCEKLQGYFFSRPIPVSQISALFSV